MVPVNQALPAIRRLRSNSVLELERSNERKAYAGRFYKPVNGTKAYLVRAIYENHTGNGFVAKWHRKEKILMLSYSSLGGRGKKYFSPLVINLPEKPKRVVFAYSGGI